MINMKRLALYLITLVCCLSSESAAQAIKVTLLGTGCPPPVMERFGPSILVEAGDQKLIFDAGRGAMQRLTQINVQWHDVTGVFLTHLHSDHVVGFPDLWLTGWLYGRGREVPLAVWGPAGTANMMDHLTQAFAEDIRIRQEEDKKNPRGVVMEVKEISDGLVVVLSGVKVTVFAVDHGAVKPAFGYRVDYAGHSVVLSGDTKYSENLIRYARGADVVIHEVAAIESLRRAGYSESRIETIIGHHTSPEEAARVFGLVSPKLAVYSHIVRPDATEEDILVPTRAGYSGRVEVGEDLMSISIGDSVAVNRPR